MTEFAESAVAGIEKKPSKIDELIAQLNQEAERQSMAIESLQRVTKSVVRNEPSEPRNETLMDSSKIAEVPHDSQLVENLRDILRVFERNTNRLHNLADRIEL